MARQNLADRLLAAKAPGATVDDLKKVLSTPPLNNDSEDWVTLQSIIVAHGREGVRVYAAAGNGRKRGWNVYRFR